jgi:signal transduction histidine kinase
LELAQALAQQVTLAMQLARLAEQDQQAALLAERNRLARDIHDTLAQGFTGIVIQLEAAEDVLGQDEAQVSAHLDRARALARASLAEARRSVYALRPQSLEHTPLPHALRASLEALTAQTPLRLDWALPEHWPAVAPALEEDLLRMAQEAVTNVLKHARARQVEVRLSARDGQLVLEVRDDGDGFVPPAGPGSAQGGFGLLGLRERAERHGGTLVIESTVGEGTVVRCEVPLKNA